MDGSMDKRPFETDFIRLTLAVMDVDGCCHFFSGGLTVQVG